MNWQLSRVKKKRRVLRLPWWRFGSLPLGYTYWLVGLGGTAVSMDGRGLDELWRMGSFVMDEGNKRQQKVRLMPPCVNSTANGRSSFRGFIVLCTLVSITQILTQRFSSMCASSLSTLHSTQQIWTLSATTILTFNHWWAISDQYRIDVKRIR